MRNSVLQRIGITSIACLLSIVFSGCTLGNQRSDVVGYGLDGPVIDYNTSTVAGYTGGSLAAFPRVNTGFSYVDGMGNRLADTEFGTVQVKLGKPTRVDMSINEHAQFSDGQPITCDDILLSWLARRPQKNNLFHAMSMPGLSEISTITCDPHSKQAKIVFRSEQLPRDWLALFGAGSIMPWHIVSEKTGVHDIRKLLSDKNSKELHRVADFWNHGWRLDHSPLDLDRFVSSGPYKIANVGDDGTITLERNDKWWGDPARVSKIIIYSTRANLKQQIRDGHVRVADISSEDTNPPTPEESTSAVISSENIMQLRLSTHGVFSNVQRRRAFLRCIPLEKITAYIARNNEVTTTHSEEVHSHIPAAIVPLDNEPVAQQISSWTTLDRRPSSTRPPRRQRVNVVYPAGSSHAQHIIKLVSEDCKSSGFSVVGVPTEVYTGEILSSSHAQAALFGTAGAVGPGGSFDSASGLVGLSPYRLPDFTSGDARGLFATVRRLNNLQGETMPIQQDGSDRYVEFAHSVAHFQQYVYDMGYAIPLYVQLRWQFVRNDLQGVTQGRSAASVGWNMDRWGI